MEIEAKFRVPDEESLRRLAETGELGGLPLGEGRLKEISDTYLDTPAWSAFKAGYSCRRREGDGGVLITLKELCAAEASVHRREELEVLVPAGATPAEWPEGPVRDLVLGIVGEGSIEPMVTLKQRRTVRLVGAVENPVAELSLDEVTVAGVDAPYFEVEVELKEGGTEQDLEVLAAALRDEWGLEPEPRSKFARAVASLGLYTGSGAAAPASETPPDVAPAAAAMTEPVYTPAAAVMTEISDAEVMLKGKRHGRKHGDAGRDADEGAAWEVRAYAPPEARAVREKPGIEPGDTMAVAAKKTLLFHLLRMIEHEPGTRAGEDAEELHDMRVATRRMRAALRVFRDYLDPKAFRPFLKVMRETGQTLGLVRDLDVFRIKTQVYIDSLPDEAKEGLDSLLGAWEEERERDREKMLAFLDGGRYLRFRDRFEEFLRTPGAGELPRFTAEDEPLPSRVQDVLPALLYDRLAHVRAFDEWIHASDVQLVRFHQLRIASKGLRYTLEFFQEVLGPDSKLVIDKTKLLQDHLGDMQDAIVSCDVLLGFLTTGTWGPPQARKLVPRGMAAGSPGVAVYLAAKEMEIQTLRSTFPPVWQKIRGSEFSRPLAGLVAALQSDSG